MFKTLSAIYDMSFCYANPDLYTLVNTHNDTNTHTFIVSPTPPHTHRHTHKHTHRHTHTQTHTQTHTDTHRSTDTHTKTHTYSHK